MKRILSVLFAIVLVLGLPCSLEAFSETNSMVGSSVSAQDATTAVDSAAAGAGADVSSDSGTASSEESATSTTAGSTADESGVLGNSALSNQSSVESQSAYKASKAASIAPASTVDETQEGTAYKTGEVLVVFKDSAESETAKSTLNDAATVKDGQADEKEAVTDNAVVAEVADGVTVSQAVNELSQDPDVAIAQPNYIYHSMDDDSQEDTTALAAESNPMESAIAAQTELAAQAVSINDPFASYQWQLSDSGYGVKCYSAWTYARGDGSLSNATPVGVAVIDTGCLTTHEDLTDNIEGAYNSYAKATNTGSTSDVTDYVGHGTHVSGIVSAETGNGIGVSGVSYNAKVIPVKASDNSDTGNFTSASLVAAYTYIIANKSTYNIRVANMSLGGQWSDEPSSGYGSNTGDAALLKEIDAANDAGILTVCAAGNSGINLPVPYDCYPGDYSTCLSVINLTSSGERNRTSNYNDSATTEASANGSKDISAPGTSILSTYSSSSTKLGQYQYASNGYYYGNATGTSMASPVVAGVAALVFAADGSLSADAVKDILEKTATDLGSSGWDCEYGYGEVNAYYAVADASGKWISDSTCTVADASYTGSPVKTAVEVDGVVLTEGTDYTAEYSNNIDAGTATVQIIGAGDYVGSVTKTYTIDPVSISMATASSINAQDCIYTGNAITPSVTLTWNGMTLAEDKNYTVSYSDNINEGTATITFQGIGNFTGTKTVLFAISRYGTDVLGCGSAGAVYTIHTQLAANRLIDIAGRSTANGGNAQMYAGNETPAQRFFVSFSKISGDCGYYTLTNVYSGKVVDVAGGGFADGANVQQYEANGSAAQQWVLTSSSVSGCYTLTNVGSGKVLDVAGNSTANGANLQIYTANGTSAQMFAFDACEISSIGKSSTYAIESSINDSYACDVAGGSVFDCANVQLYQYNGTNAQLYSFSYDENTGYYVIGNKGSGKVLDVAGGGTSNGTIIWQYTPNGSWAQKWSLKASGHSYVLYCACNGLVVDLSDARVVDGSSIQCYEANGTAAQKWILAAA